MNTFDLGKILDEVHWEEYAEFDNPPHRIKSLRHRLRMRRIMNQAVAKHDKPVQRTRLKMSPRKVLILLVLIFTAIITAAAIVVWYGNIYGQKHSDNTELFAVVEGAPEVIEEIYELTEIPEGFELKKKAGDIGEKHIYKLYASDNNCIDFEQFTRKCFKFNNDIERSEYDEIVIDDMKALVFHNNNKVTVYCDTDNYIVRISTDITPISVENLVKMTNVR